ncbi:Elongation of very long chain fatty acids protein 4 [Blattella germanica]|nr:Elongation of very long chain fatty acids protein 4 [Blattella germanica]
MHNWRVKDWLFLSSPYPFACILTCYFSIIYFGRNLMKTREPYSLRKVLFVYNTLQIILSTYIFKEMAEAFWWFTTSKVFDLLDTVFFVLRKKENQLTFLHVYHHSSMLPNWYLGTLYLPGGQAFFSAMLNSLVHIIMYCYYLLSALGPEWQPYLWWKKYLTQLQLTQFLVVIGHILVGVYNDCDPPHWLTTWTLSYMCTMVALFLNYYYQMYRMPSLKTKFITSYPTENIDNVVEESENSPEAEEDWFNCQLRKNKRNKSNFPTNASPSKASVCCPRRGEGDKKTG